LLHQTTTISRPAAQPAVGGNTDPAALLRDLSLHFRAIGISRLARQTGLDRLSIPVYAAIRPNSATIATHHGKGLDELSAQISAVMEAAEYAVAEAPETPQLVLSPAAARDMGFEIYDFTHLLPHATAIDENRPVRWVEGVELGTGITVLVPYDAVVLGTAPADFPGIAQSTNGIGAGTSLSGAVLHALCEIVERDAVCLWSYKSDKAARAAAIAPSAFDDADIDALDFRIAEAGCQLRLYDQTSNSGLPVIYAVLSPGDGADKHFDAATGASCHPVAAIAARRAIVEAAQTRITNIAGARDDIIGAEYDQDLGRSIAVLTEPGPTPRQPPAGLERGAPTDELIAHMRAGLKRAGTERVVVVPMGGSRFGIHVVRVFVPGLEDRLTNRNWRPGKRAAAAMLGFL
jgi:YcaO-like protein with predicted kinase domain